MISTLKWPADDHSLGKQAAAAKRISLNDWILEAIREKLARQNGGKSKKRGA